MMLEWYLLVTLTRWIKVLVKTTEKTSLKINIFCLELQWCQNVYAYVECERGSVDIDKLRRKTRARTENATCDLEQQCEHIKNSFIKTKKAFKKQYIFILRRFGLFLIHLQSKNKAICLVVLFLTELFALFFDWRWIKNIPKRLKIKMYRFWRLF